MSERPTGVTRRRAAATEAAGVAEIAPGQWALHGVDLDMFFTMRRTPPEQRAGFRAWVAEQDRRAVVKRHLVAWDNLWRAYQAAPMI